MKFVENCVTHVPTECLIEDYQNLQLAVNNEDWDNVKTVMECLAEVIDRYTAAPDGIRFKPSVSTLISMPVSNGIIAKNNGLDIKCANGHGVSEAMPGGVLQAHCDACPLHETAACEPEAGRIRLHNDFLYTGASSQADSLMTALESEE